MTNTTKENNMITTKQTTKDVFSTDTVNSLRFNASIFMQLGENLESTVYDALEKLEQLQGVKHWKTTSFKCKYHFNRAKELNLLVFCAYINKLGENAEINGHWIWVENANDSSMLVSKGFKKCNSGNRLGQYYIKAYGQNWNTGMTKQEVIRILHS